VLPSLKRLKKRIIAASQGDYSAVFMSRRYGRLSLLISFKNMFVSGTHVHNDIALVYYGICQQVCTAGASGERVLYFSVTVLYLGTAKN
jgi:hypothetical protein